MLVLYWLKSPYQNGVAMTSLSKRDKGSSAMDMARNRMTLTSELNKQKMTWYILDAQCSIFDVQARDKVQDRERERKQMSERETGR
jgi:hypothetical protein